MDGSPGSRAPARRWPGRRGLLAFVVVGVVVALAGVAFLLGTRSRHAEPAVGAVKPAPNQHVYLLQPSGGAPSRVALEVAADEPARERGLSNRAELPPGTGMAFLFRGDTQIPFFGGDGRVVGVFEMPPCRADPCPTYAPTRPYRYAVELRSDGFTAAGIHEGDRVVPQDPSTLPAPS